MDRGARGRLIGSVAADVSRSVITFFMTIRESMLRSLPQFADLSDNAMARIAALCVPRVFDRGRMIHVPGQEDDNTYLILSGEVGLYQAAHGKRILIQVLKPGDIFGNLMVTDHAAVLQGSNAVAMETTHACVIASHDAERMVAECPAFAMLALTSLRGRLHHAEGKIKDLAVSNAQTRVINELIRHIVRHGEERGGFYEIEEKLTHQSIADMAGIARETATKVLGLLEKGDMISWSADGLLRLHIDQVRRTCPQCLILRNARRM